MDFSHYLTPRQVLTRPDAASYADLLETLLEKLLLSPSLAAPCAVSPAAVQQAIRTQVAEQPLRGTELVAFPHARISGLPAIALAAAIAPGIRDTSTGPLPLVLMAAVPMEAPALALQLLAKIGRFAHDEAAVEGLFALQEAGAACAYLQEHMLHNDGVLCARDIMREPLVRIYPETPLRDVTRMMLAHNLDAAGVVDHEDCLLGEITCDQLFLLGVPDFFRQLKSVSFISEFNPFERYFEQESNKTAGTVMSSRFCALPPQASVLEVVFEMAVHHHTKVHVVDNGKRVGVIDRILVLDKILNL